MKTRKLTIGHKSEFKSAKFADSPHATAIEGFYVCTICSKNLNTSEAAVRSHLRKHVRDRELRQVDYFDTVQRVCRRK